MIRKPFLKVGIIVTGWFELLFIHRGYDEVETKQIETAVDPQFLEDIKTGRESLKLTLPTGRLERAV